MLDRCSRCPMVTGNIAVASALQECRVEPSTPGEVCDPRGGGREPQDQAAKAAMGTPRASLETRKTLPARGSSDSAVSQSPARAEVT